MPDRTPRPVDTNEGVHDAVSRTVRRFWGHETLRPLQAESIQAGLEHRDSLVVMPTGGGKSLCYQVPPIVADRTDLVISPLISLMKDQVDGLRACGYPAAGLHSGLTPDERRDVLDGMRGDRFRLVFVSPERLVTGGFTELIARMGVRAFAIDEAHCISHWGHDFRPEYRQLAWLKDRFEGASVHAFTATATPRVRQDIADQLRLEDPNVLVGCFDRPNLTYRVIPRVDVQAQLLEIVRRHPREAVIVYCITRRDTETLAAVLKKNGVEAAAYHAGMDTSTRRRTQEAFSEERLDVIVATVAFGMGIDRGDVRCVVHAAMPKSIEHYQQETGRAGRDGLEAECVLLYSAADVMRWQGLVQRAAASAYEEVYQGPAAAGGEGPALAGGDETAPGETTRPEDGVAAQLELLNHMQGLCSTLECRHRSLSRYFGQDYESDDCGACDVCLGEVESMADATVVAQKIISCVARLERMNRRYGVGHIVQILRGADTETIRSWGHDQLSTYGLLHDRSEKALTNLVYQLVDQNLLARSVGDRPVLQLSPHSTEVLRDEREVRLVEPATARRGRAKSETASWEGVDRALFEHLREVRREIARKRKVPPYVVFGDESLRSMARIRPASLETFRGVRGVGEKKLADLGAMFVEAIDDYCGERELDRDVDVISRPMRPATGSGGGGGEKRPRANRAKDQAMTLFKRGAPLDEVAATTGRSLRTVVGYLAEYIEIERPARVDDWVHDALYDRVTEAAGVAGRDRLRPIHEQLDGQVPYETIQIVLAHQKAMAD